MKSIEEKRIKYEEIRNEIIPSLIKDQSPIIYKLLELLICDNSIKKITCKNILVLIKEYLNKLKDTSKSKKISSRRRFLSEDNEGQKKFEIYFKLDDERNDDWQTM